MFISVDLPDPDEPMMATNSPCWTVRLIPRSASTLKSPSTKVRVRFSTLMTGCCQPDRCVLHRRVASKARRRQLRARPPPATLAFGR